MHAQINSLMLSEFILFVFPFYTPLILWAVKKTSYMSVEEEVLSKLEMYALARKISDFTIQVLKYMLVLIR